MCNYLFYLCCNQFDKYFVCFLFFFYSNIAMIGKIWYENFSITLQGGVSLVVLILIVLIIICIITLNIIQNFNIILTWYVFVLFLFIILLFIYFIDCICNKTYIFNIILCWYYNFCYTTTNGWLTTMSIIPKPYEFLYCRVLKYQVISTQCK